jgi:hypothetical protein
LSMIRTHEWIKPIRDYRESRALTGKKVMDRHRCRRRKEFSATGTSVGA